MCANVNSNVREDSIGSTMKKDKIGRKSLELSTFDLSSFATWELASSAGSSFKTKWYFDDSSSVLLDLLLAVSNVCLMVTGWVRLNVDEVGSMIAFVSHYQGEGVMVGGFSSSCPSSLKFRPGWRRHCWWFSRLCCSGKHACRLCCLTTVQGTSVSCIK